MPLKLHQANLNIDDQSLVARARWRMYQPRGVIVAILSERQPLALGRG